MPICKICQKHFQGSQYRDVCFEGACLRQSYALGQAANEEAGKDPRVVAVRADKAVGRGSCSSIDECYENVELLAKLNRDGVKTPREAVKWAREVDGLHWESGLNQMFGDGGESDQHIRACHDEWKALNALPIEAGDE